MGRINHILFLALFCILLQGCAKSEINLSPKQIQSVYSEKIVKTELPAEISIECDNCILEVYSWKNDEVKFEMSEIVKADQTKNINSNEMKDYNVEIRQDGAKVTCISKYKGASRKKEDMRLELKLTIPKRVQLMNLSLDQGSVTFIDDVKYDLNINVNSCNTEINNLMGCINYSGHTGNIRISGGKIENNSCVTQETGNISVKAELSQGGPFRFETKAGNIGLSFPSDSELNFENVGDIERNDFKPVSGYAKVYTKTEIGTISIRKY